MAKLPLTVQEKQDKKLRSQLLMAHNQVLSAWSFKEITTWEGVYRKLGFGADYINQHPEYLRGSATYPEVKAFLQKQKDSLELDIDKAHNEYNKAKEEHQAATLRDTNNPSSNSAPAQPIHGSILRPYAASDKLAELLVKEMLDKVEPDNLAKEIIFQKKAKKEEPTSKDNYGLIPSPNETCKFFWFQKKAIADGWEKLYTRNLPSVLILAGTGTGKTWMGGGMLRRFMDINYHDDKTMSHIPYLIVTKASIIKQTERVVERDFGLGVEDTSVVNYDALRSTAGKFWLKRDLVILNGEETEKWTWKKNIQPAVIWWDEPQALKNAGSLQHNIACALNDMGRFQPKQIFTSATPFT